MATQPFGAPDEASHYLRALNIANGTLLGPKIPYPNVPLTPAQQGFVNHDTRAVEVPARLSPPDVACINGKPDTTGRCVEASPTGDYYPPAYVLPAVALKVASNADTGLWLSRFRSAASCFAFIALAIALLWNGSGWSLLGLLAARPPMVLFVSSILNPSGLDTAASIALAAAALRIARAPTRVPRWVWIAAAISAAITILSFQAGPAFAAADLAVAIGLLGGSGLRELRCHSHRQLGFAGLTIMAALVLWFVYGRSSGASHSQFAITPIRQSLRLGLDQLGPVLRDAVGNFGGLTVQLPAPAHWIWWLLVLGLVGTALWLADRRERLLMGVVVLVALAFPVLSFAWVYRHRGFGMQGRQVLPVLVLIPLLAGELINRHRVRLARRQAGGVLGGAIAAIALFQAYAWWYDARAVAGAPGTLRFYAHAIWSPPIGWVHGLRSPVWGRSRCCGQHG